MFSIDCMSSPVCLSAINVFLCSRRCAIVSGLDNCCPTCFYFSYMFNFVLLFVYIIFAGLTIVFILVMLWAIVVLRFRLVTIVCSTCLIGEMLVRKSGGLVRKSGGLCGNPRGLCGNPMPCAEIRGLVRKSGGLVRKSEVLIREMCFGGPVAPLSAKQSLKTNSNAKQSLKTNSYASGSVGRQNNVSFPNVRVFV